MKENEINILHYLNNTVEEKTLLLFLDFSRFGVTK